MPRSPAEIRSQTGLRGVAACYVTADHFFQTLPFGQAEHAFPHGYIAVDLFFVLSFFVILLAATSYSPIEKPARDWSARIARGRPAVGPSGVSAPSRTA